ncbi:MAG: hypothetical protein AB1598_12015 [Thermodesulfobacteriota bacterium]
MDKLNAILTEKRHVTSAYHAHLGRYWRLYGESRLLHAPLSYSAFEFRLAMERSLLELFYLMSDRKLSDEELNYDFGQVLKSIYKFLGGRKVGKKRLMRWMEFNLLYQKLLGTKLGYPKKKVAIIDVEKVNKFWCSLSKYCHRQLLPESTWNDKKWILGGYKLLNQVETYIWEIMVNSSLGWLDPNSLPPEIQAVVEDFIIERIDIKILEGRLQLMIPVLMQRGIKRINIITLTT